MRPITKKNGIRALFIMYLSIITILTLVVNFILNCYFISNYYNSLEKETIINKTNLAWNIFRSQIDSIEATCKDYALWDEPYHQVQKDRIDEQWFRDNYTDYLPRQFGVDLVMVVDAGGELIAKRSMMDSELLKNPMLSNVLKTEVYTEEAVVSGFVDIQGSLYIVSACPIFQSDQTGSCQGLVLIGKEITPVFISEINDKFGNDIFITHKGSYISSQAIAPVIQQHQNEIRKNSRNTIFQLGDTEIVGKYPVKDISGDVISDLNVIESRDIYLNTQKVTKQSVAVAFLLSMTLIAILAVRFRSIIIKPIEGLEAQIKKMRDSNSLKHTIINGPDEINSLSASFNLMIDSILTHEKENLELKAHLNTDPLTSAYNHKYYHECLNKLIHESNKTITVIYSDLDKFKLINDFFGHQTGDVILQEVANIMKNIVGSEGMVFRYGGEEFITILPGLDVDAALKINEKIRTRIEKESQLQKYAEYFPVTISSGIANYPNHALDTVILTQKADHAMQYSKLRGRNQSSIYRSDMEILANNQSLRDKDLLIDSALALSEAVDAKDNYTGKHSKMVLQYSLMIAEKIGFSDHEKYKLRIGALLHDCGKIGIPDSIIQNPGKLTLEEYEVVKNHTLIGYNIIRHISSDDDVMHCIRSHHERFDGKGYPDGLDRESINQFARIVCIADSYHAMTSNRPYRNSMTKNEAIKELQKERGKQYDPVLLDHFIEVLLTS